MVGKQRPGIGNMRLLKLIDLTHLGGLFNDSLGGKLMGINLRVYYKFRATKGCVCSLIWGMGDALNEYEKWSLNQLFQEQRKKTMNNVKRHIIWLYYIVFTRH